MEDIDYIYSLYKKLNNLDRHSHYIISKIVESYFCGVIAPQYGIIAELNPEKKNDLTTLDLRTQKKDKSWTRAELKIRLTPFFTAQKYFGVHPQYALTLDVRKIESYKKKKYKLEPIFIWIDWRILKWNHIAINKLSGVWWCTMEELLQYINYNNPPIHYHIERINDKTGNSKNNYIIDIREPIFKKLKKI